ARRKTRPNFDADTARLENDLAERLGAVAHIEPGRKGAGRIVIRYSTLDQLEGLLQRMGVATKESR
ncbi:MAG: chromosome partitioning protein ParB, partial [Casimicrobiaceae bacterium]